MKTSRSKRRAKTYNCRKCTRTDFKSPIEFTNHLRNCRGLDVPVTRIPIVPVQAPTTNGRKNDLWRLHHLAAEMQALTTKLLREAK